MLVAGLVSMPAFGGPCQRLDRTRYLTTEHCMELGAEARSDAQRKLASIKKREKERSKKKHRVRWTDHLGGLRQMQTPVLGKKILG